MTFEGIETLLLEMRARWQSRVLGRPVSVEEIRADEEMFALADMCPEDYGDEAGDGAGHASDAHEHQSGSEGS